MTEREQKLQRALEWLINLHEDAFNKRGDYCQEFCPVRDHDQNCPALYVDGCGEIVGSNDTLCREQILKCYMEESK